MILCQLIILSGVFIFAIPKVKNDIGEQGLICIFLILITVKHLFMSVKRVYFHDISYIWMHYFKVIGAESG